MPKPSKDRDRRAVVEAMRREQERAERRRTVVVIAACVAVGVVIIGAAAVPLLRQHRLSSGSLADIGASADAAACRDVVTRKATGNQDHKPVGTTIRYPDAPPADGPHYPTPADFSRKFYTADDRPKLEYLVHNLEHGYTILWYDATVARDKDELATVKAVAATFEGSKLTDKFIAAPWTAADGRAFPDGAHVALTHWSAGADPTDTTKQRGVWQYCGRPSGAVVRSFTRDYPYSDSPEPQGA